MSTISNWFKEIIRDKVRMRYAAMGGYLDGMFATGDGGAGSIKFPVAGGNINMYELTGSISEIDASTINNDVIEVSIRDFEAAAFMRIQDERKVGPSQQDALSQIMTRAVRKKKDFLKIDALAAFAAATSTLQDSPSTIETIGDGSARIDVEFATYIGTSIAGTGSEEEVFCVIPYAWMDQLMLTKYFASSDYQGPADLPLAKASKVKKKTFQGTHFFALPNEYFYTGTGAYGTGSNNLPFNGTGYIDTFAWAKDAVGAEIEWDQESMTMDKVPHLKGSPTLCKVQLSGNAVGIIPEGVKRIRMLAINKATAT